MFVINQNCREGMTALSDNSVDAIVTDPPYGLSKEPNAAEVLRHWLAGDDYTATGGGFMGKSWDSFVPGPATWREAFRVLKPGGYALVFAGSRTQDLMSMALRLAGFEIRDNARYWYEDEEPKTPDEAKAAARAGGGMAWLYGSGFPKSLDISKAVDAADAVWVRRERALKFTAWMRSTGIKAAAVKQALVESGAITDKSNLAGHYFETSQPVIATLDMFEKIRHLLPEPPADVMELMQWRTVESENMKRREVVGKQAGTLLAVAPGQDNDRSGVELDITAAHTDEAKQWEGWGTALKPAYEPIIIARKPLAGTVADNVLTWGVGAINVDGCRVPHAGAVDLADSKAKNPGRTDTVSSGVYGANRPQQSVNDSGRWPANILHDGCLSDEPFGRYFYCAKASKADRNEGLDHLPQATAGEVTGGRAEGSDGLNSPRAGAGRTSGARNIHPTVKPTELMRYLCRMVTPLGGLILDPFAGSGSTGKGAILEGLNFIGFELDPQYTEIANARILHALTNLPLSDKVAGEVKTK